MVGTIQGVAKAEIGASPGESLLWTYEGPIADSARVQTPLTQSIGAVVTSLRVDQAGGGMYSVSVYQTYTRSQGSAYDRGALYFSIYRATPGGSAGGYLQAGTFSTQDSAVTVAAFAIGQG